jgi:hypothetical protein
MTSTTLSTKSNPTQHQTAACDESDTYTHVERAKEVEVIDEGAGDVVQVMRASSLTKVKVLA